MFVPLETAKRLSELPSDPCPLCEAGYKATKPIFAELLDSKGRRTGNFVRLSQAMVEKIMRKIAEDIDNPPTTA